MPWFVNWDDYKTTFEQEAAKILGHPVQVLGSANASILPSPSLTFTDVRVGDPDGQPMMTVDRFDVTIELTPLLQGEIRVTSMRLERPDVRVVLDENGTAAWLQRSASAEAFNPDRIALANVTISQGAVEYSDARSGVSLGFGGITASIEARSLAGPWKIDGSYLDEGVAVPFSIGSGRLLEDGTIRVTAHASPRQWPVEVSADGIIANNETVGLSYSGTYIVTELVENTTGEAIETIGGGESSGWRSEGTFALTGDRLKIDQAVLSNGPPDRPSSVAGSLDLMFGSEASFNASLEARQLDLDRTLGGGPNQPVDISTAGENLVAWLRGLPIPSIPGRIAFNVPAIVVGGAVIQDVAFAAEPESNGWRVRNLNARLPGQATVSGEGLIRTDRNIGFTGTARLAVVQPTTFASWWRGRSGGSAGNQLAAFDIAGQVDAAPGRLSLDDVSASIGGASISGRFAWTASPAERRLGADLTADRIDFGQVEALAQLLAGRDLSGINAFADSYSLRLTSGVVRYNDIELRDVAVDAGYADDTLNVVQFAVGDLGGANFRVTSGRIDGLTISPKGHLDARLEVMTVDGLAAVVARFLPGTGLVEWLGRTADVTTPAYVDARIAAQTEEQGGLAVTLRGVAGATTFDASFASASSRPSGWRSSSADVSIDLQSPDSAALARQFGFTAVAVDDDPGAVIGLRATGIPDTGLTTEGRAEIAGLSVDLDGTATWNAGETPAFTGTFGLNSSDVALPLATAGLSVPGSRGRAVVASGRLAVANGVADLIWRDGRVGEYAVGGDVRVSRNGDRGLRADGALTADVVDLGWLASLGLGVSPFIEPASDSVWPSESFAPPGFGALSGKFSIAAGRLDAGAAIAISNAQMAVALQPQRIDVDLSSGDLAGGKAGGGFSIHNVEGNAALSGQVSLTAAALESFVWRRDERAVATGLLDISASFEATGRSTAGLIASMTGGGIVSVSEGELRYVDLAPAVQQIIRASDLGQEFTDDSLRLTLAEQIGANPLTVGEVGGAFTIAAGAARLRGMTLRGAGTDGTGNVVIDLNSKTLESDWTFAFDPGDDKVEGSDPRVGIVFRGPIAMPSRTIDALALGSYLNTRREARILEVIALEEASRAERARFDRLLAKLDQDKARAARLAQEAAERAERRRVLAIATAAAALQLHAQREIVTDERQAAALEEAASQAAAMRDAAREAAQAAAERSATENARAAELAERVPPLAAQDQAAATESARAAEALVAAEDFASTTAAAAGAARSAADRAESDALTAMSAESAAAEAARAAMQAKAEADSDLSSATAAFDEANTAAEQARAANISAQAALDAAGRTVSGALAASEDAAAALREAEAVHAERSAAAEAAGRVQSEAAQRALTASAERARAQTEANIAATAAEKAAADRDLAEAHLREMETQLSAAEAALAAAAGVVGDATRLASVMEADPLSDQQTVTSARGLVTAAKLRQAARQADVDRLRVEVANARAALDNSGQALAEAAAAVEAARSGIADAVARAEAAEAAAKEAMAANSAALNALSDAAARREAAAAEVQARDEGARAAGTAFDDAQGRAAAAAAALDEAESALVTATAIRDQATAIATAKAGEAEGESARAQAAAAARDAAVAAAMDATRKSQAAAAAAAEAGDRLIALRDAEATARAAAEAAHAALRDAEAEAQAAANAAAEAQAAAEDAARIAAERSREADRAAERLTAFSGEGDLGLAEMPADGALRPLNLLPAASGGPAAP